MVIATFSLKMSACSISPLISSSVSNPSMICHEIFCPPPLKNSSPRTNFYGKKTGPPRLIVPEIFGPCMRILVPPFKHVFLEVLMQR